MRAHTLMTWLSCSKPVAEKSPLPCAIF
jgi:hypothetical protein